MADTQVDEKRDAAADRKAAGLARQTARLAGRIQAFGREHGGAEAQLAYIGERGARIVLVGEDGGWGDLVAPSYAMAQSAAEQAGVTVHESFDGDLAAKVRTGPYEWKRMAGIQLGGSRAGAGG
ncbi:hypothetical protein G3I19_13045 [Streptomyces sp. SID10853]|uniref:hypothetical protein n=1 Tax=Streptomyces sp. SID10853 TaxID=2706028 RepID=UPI0013C11D06|nr:hypothetical protein [Streptomyces sp. SID10853]NDZ79428.1 hypothetical protein [Streptomyces sp. SID10853]